MYVNLYGSNSMTTRVAGKAVTVSQQTGYPFDGNINIIVDRNQAGAFEMAVRIPGWVRGEVAPGGLYRYADNNQQDWSISVNGIPQQAEVQNGYVVINRKWKKGDTIHLNLPMTPRRIVADRRVVADRNRNAITCGPLVYCAEGVDNQDFNMDGMVLPQNAALSYQSTQQSDYAAIGGATIQTQTQVLSYDQQGSLQLGNHNLRLIPYYQWNHRGPGRMMVWIPFKPQAVSLGDPKNMERNKNEFFQE